MPEVAAKDLTYAQLGDVLRGYNLSRQGDTLARRNRLYEHIKANATESAEPMSQDQIARVMFDVSSRSLSEEHVREIVGEVLDERFNELQNTFMQTVKTYMCGQLTDSQGEISAAQAGPSHVLGSGPVPICVTTVASSSITTPVFTTVSSVATPTVTSVTTSLGTTTSSGYAYFRTPATAAASAAPPFPLFPAAQPEHMRGPVAPDPGHGLGHLLSADPVWAPLGLTAPAPGPSVGGSDSNTGHIGVERYWRYLDDFLTCGPPGSPDCQRDLDALLDCLGRAGFDASDEKTVEPTTRLEILGIIVDTVQQLCQLSAERLGEIMALLLRWRGVHSATNHDIQVLAGKLNFAASVVVPGRTYLRRILNCLSSSTHESKHDQVTVDSDFQADISWWVEFLHRWNVLSAWTDRARCLIMGSVRPGTLRGYQSSIRAYWTFCGAMVCSPLPVLPHVLLAHVASLIDRGLSDSSVGTHIAAVRFYDTASGGSGSAFDSPQLKALRRSSRMNSPPPTGVRPLTGELIRRMWPFVDASSGLHRCSWTALLVCYYGAFRLGELLGGTDLPPLPRSAVQAKRLSDGSLVAIINLAVSKTDPTGRGTSVPLPCITPPEICPSCALFTWVGSDILPSSSPVFIIAGTPLSRAQFVRLMHNWLAATGVSPTGFSGHSLRKGAATTAALRGVSSGGIMRLGRWKSSCYTRYVVPDAADRLRVAGVL